MPSPARGLTQPQRVETSARRLIEAAAELITEKGWEATTAAEIGRRAGYSRAMVHARYGGKDAIIDTLFRTTYEARLGTTPDDDANGLYRVALPSGRVDALGNAGHVDGEGEGIDATKLGNGRLHVLTVDVAFTPVWMGNVAVAGTDGKAK